MKKSLLKNNGVQSLIASLLCIVLGMLIGYIVLLFINPTGAGEAIITVMKNFLNYNRADTQLKYLGNTLVKTAPLLMCALSILFAYKVGLFNIGASGQYTAGACAALYAAGHRRRLRHGRHCGSAEGLLQRQRGHQRHHAELDHAVYRQYDPG